MTQPQIDEHFKEEWDGAVIAKFRNQQAGRLKSTVRMKSGTRGSKTIFRLIGKSAAYKGKPRHGQLTALNPERTTVEIIPDPWYAPHWVEEKDLTRLDADDKAILQANGSNALDEAVDMEVIKAVVAAAAGDNVIGAGSARFTMSTWLQSVTQLQKKSKMGGGQIYSLLDPASFAILNTYKEFTSADFVPGFPAQAGRDSRVFQGVNVLMVPDEYLAPVSTARKLPFYISEAVGIAMQQEMRSIWSWENTHDAWFCNMSLDAGFAALQPDGCVVAHVLNSNPADVFIERDQTV